MGEGVKLVNNSGKTGVLNNNLFWQRNYKFRTEKLKSEKVSRSTGHDLWEKQDLSCTTIGESEFRLMNSTLQTEVWCNLKRFLSLGRKSVLASPQKWRVSGRVHLFGLLVWGKSFFSSENANSQCATVDKRSVSSDTWLRHENSNAQSLHLYLRTPII